MDAPIAPIALTPMGPPETSNQSNKFIIIQKDLVSESGNDYSLQISFNDQKFAFLIEQKGKLLSEKYRNEYTISQIQENKYFKLFSDEKEILEELKERIEANTPILNICNNNSINLTIFLPTSKYKEIEFNLIQDKSNSIDNIEELKSIVIQLCEKVDKLTKENRQILEENRRIKEENKEIKNKLEIIDNELNGNKQNKIENNIFDKTKTFKQKVLHWINKEVNIISNSDFITNYPPDIMIGKKEGPYSLTNGNKNHFVEFEFDNNYYLEAIRIKVERSFDVSLKTFKVETISQNGERYNLGSFKRKKGKDIEGFQEFKIKKECKGLKLYLVDNWGSSYGNYILISRIDFNVCDI